MTDEAKPLTDAEIESMERSACIEVGCYGTGYCEDVVSLAGDLLKARELLRASIQLRGPGLCDEIRAFLGTGGGDVG